MKAKIFCLVAALAMFSAAPCHSTTVYVTYTGHVYNFGTPQTDYGGQFGSAGADLQGSAYTGFYVLDVEFGPHYFQGDQIPDYYYYIDSGTKFGPGYVSPAVSAGLTINGITVYIPGVDYDSIITGFNDGSNQSYQSHHVINSNHVELFNILQVYNADILANITTPFYYEYVTGFDNTGIYCFEQYKCIQFSLETLRVSLTDPTAATPLPAALPLFATGLGALGLLGWRRKRKAAALAA